MLDNLSPGEGIIKGIIAFGFSLFGWIIKRAYTRIDGLEAKLEKVDEKVDDVRIDLPTNYATKEDVKDLGNKLSKEVKDAKRDVLDAINSKLI